MFVNVKGIATKLRQLYDWTVTRQGYSKGEAKSKKYMYTFFEKKMPMMEL